MTIPQHWDMPDDYPWLPGSARYPMVDMGELAARLGSPVTWDRRGEVLFIERGLSGWNAWQKIETGSGGLLQPDTAYAYSSPYSLLIQPGLEAGAQLGVYRDFKPQRYGKLGLEWCFYPGVIAHYIVFTIEYSQAGLKHDAKIVFDTTAKTMSYWSSAGALVVLDTVDLSTIYNGDAFYLKLVLDVESNMYERVLFNDRFYSLSGIAVRNYTTSTNHRFWVGCYIQPDLAETKRMWLYHFILTGNEP